MAVGVVDAELVVDLQVASTASYVVVLAVLARVYKVVPFVSHFVVQIYPAAKLALTTGRRFI